MNDIHMKAIQAERRRQIEVEGFSPAADSKAYTKGQLMDAAHCYYAAASERFIGGWSVESSRAAPDGWPWDIEWWKPKSLMRDLVRAGALCLAERERVAESADPRGRVCERVLADVIRLMELVTAVEQAAPALVADL